MWSVVAQLINDVKRNPFKSPRRQYGSGHSPLSQTPDRNRETVFASKIFIFIS